MSDRSSMNNLIDLVQGNICGDEDEETVDGSWTLKLDRERLFFDVAKQYSKLQSSQFFRVFSRLHAARKIFVFYGAYFMASLVIFGTSFACAFDLSKKIDVLLYSIRLMNLPFLQCTSFLHTRPRKNKIFLAISRFTGCKE